MVATLEKLMDWIKVGLRWLFAAGSARDSDPW